MSEELSKSLQEMAKLVIFSGKITELHEKNMKMYPYVFFEGIQSCHIDYDLSHKQIAYSIESRSNAIVTYSLVIAEDAINDQIEKRYAALESALRGLFWKDLTVEIIINDIIMYKSAK